VRYSGFRIFYAESPLVVLPYAELSLEKTSSPSHAVGELIEIAVHCCVQHVERQAEKRGLSSGRM
jgi:hypothetical protein